MEGLFNDEEILLYIRKEISEGASDTRKLSLYTQATQKNLPPTLTMLSLWTEYINLLKKEDDEEEIREIFRMLRMSYYKFVGYWKELIRFEKEIMSRRGHGSELTKVIKQGLEFIFHKNFDNKEEILEYLRSEEFEENMMKANHKESINNPSEIDNFNLNNNSIYGNNLKENNFNTNNKIYNNRIYTNGICNDNINITGTNNNKTNINETYNNKQSDNPFPNRIILACPPINKPTYQSSITQQLKYLTGKNEFKSHHAITHPNPPSYSEIPFKDNKLTILRTIGKGGSSEVFQVLLEHKIYALKKVYLAEEDDIILNGYKNEINLLDKLRGTNRIIELIDYEITESNISILLEYGEIDLASLIKRNRNNIPPLSLNFIRDLWEQMLEIVRVVHMQRIIHCDLKPANFLFVKGRIKLIDFGISKVIRNDTTNVESESLLGTINYMSPEAVKGNKNKMGRSSDIWSLGCILYELVYGIPPLHRFNSIIQKIEHLNNPRIEFPDLGLRYVPVINDMKLCLVKEPKLRASIEQLLESKFIKP
ncbi:putative serine/threonine-protein kinase MPS1 like protein [Astathelohania contejeani]|uniref:Serine/threonine-protein kinase MPS1 like protein n=1 Tax=Astathelohania contejeani TaxID=164912 RepID=A0ABQ7I070_9MICR|nr:putative serine/threonine-protein kinase MPS1 like protein [Thelohania contejeani]